jgi:hypothetical protein
MRSEFGSLREPLTERGWFAMSAPWQDQSVEAVEQPTSVEPARKRPAWIGPAAIAAVALVAGVVGFFVGRSTAGPSAVEAAQSTIRLQTAHEACRAATPTTPFR